MRTSHDWRARAPRPNQATTPTITDTTIGPRPFTKSRKIIMVLVVRHYPRITRGLSRGGRTAGLTALRHGPPCVLRTVHRRARVVHIKAVGDGFDLNMYHEAVISE